MSTAPAPLPAPRPRAASRLLRWITARRRTAVAHIFRGVCYGIGTGTVSIAAFWLQQRI